MTPEFKSKAEEFINNLILVIKLKNGDCGDQVKRTEILNDLVIPHLYAMIKEVTNNYEDQDDKEYEQELKEYDQAIKDTNEAFEALDLSYNYNPNNYKLFK